MHTTLFSYNERGRPFFEVETGEETSQAQAPVAVPGPWEITITGLTAAFTNCYYRHNSTTKVAPDISAVSLPGVGGGLVLFVSAGINTESGAATILTGPTKADVVDEALPPPEAADRVRLLLYKLVRTTESGSWRVGARLLDLPDALVY